MSDADGLLDELEIHPAAEEWPTLPESELQRMAEDIAENGLRHPIVVDQDGRILDGKNRLAACEAAGVEPDRETYEGDDPVGFVVSSNNERRHMSLTERAAATALTLATDGRRENGKWAYGAVAGSTPEDTESGTSRTWRNRMREAGLVLDWIGKDRLRRVAAGVESLNAAVQAAKQERKKQREKNLGDLEGHPLHDVVRDLIRQRGVPDDTAQEIVANAQQTPDDEVQGIIDAWESGDSYWRGRVKSRLAGVEPVPDPRLSDLVTVRRTMIAASRRFDDRWSESFRELAEQADTLKESIQNWRQDDAGP